MGCGGGFHRAGWVYGLIIGCVSGPALGLDGNNPLHLSTFNGWSTFELITQNDNIVPITEVGYGSTASRGLYDGLGAYLSGQTLSVYINHETSNAAISKLQLDPDLFRQKIQSVIDGGLTPSPAGFVEQIGYGYDKIFDGNYHAINNPNPVATGTLGVAAYGNANFDRFCSGTMYQMFQFGAGRGFADAMYLTGEEVSGGRFYTVDPVTHTMWEAPDLGFAHWENAALVDTGNTTHVALILSSDVGTNPGDYLRLYVGEKNTDTNADGTIDFLERNGLRGGTVYYFDPDGAASTTDLPDGTVTGTWNISSANALRETKLEDVHTSPFNGQQLVITDQTDGIYTIDLQMQFAGNQLDTGASPVTISQIDDASFTPITAPDNVTWSADGKIYVQEDGGGFEMWQINPDGSGRVKIAQGFTEPSGIIDVSETLGYRPGSVLLTSIMGTGSAGAQLSALISPDAQLQGDLDGDGFVGIADLNIVLSNWNQAVPPGDPLADPSGDGIVGIEDLNEVLSNWNAGTPPADIGAIPEPGTLWLGIGLLGLTLSRCRG